MIVRQRIDDFLGQKRLAVVGVSRNPRDFTRGMFAEFRRRGYDVVPVTPHASEIEGQRCFARVQDITPPVAGVLVMTRPEITEQVVRDCAAAGVKRVWLYRATGKGAMSQAALEFCQQNGIEAIPGFCPHMFFAQTSFFHRVHAFFMKLTGGYPR